MILQKWVGADRKALYSDWLAVGNDIRNAIDESQNVFEKNHRCK